MFNCLAAGLLAGASFAAIAAPSQAATAEPVRSNSGGANWTTTSIEFKTFFETGEITDRALQAAINNSGWTAEEIRWGMTKFYAVDVVGVSRFLYSEDGLKFLKDQTRSYFPYWKMKSTAVIALRSAIIADSVDGTISSAGILAELPVAFRFANIDGSYDGIQNICAPMNCENVAQCTSLMSWYVFLPACIQVNSQLPKFPHLQTHTPPVGSLW